MPKGKPKLKGLIMSNILKKKSPLYLIVIAALVLVMAIACKKSPTQPLDASVNGSSEYQNPAEVDLIAGEYKSVYEHNEGDTRNDSYRTFYYKVEVKEVNGKLNLLWKKGDYKANGTQSYGGNDYGILRSLTRDSSKDIEIEGKKAFGNINSEEVYYITISNDGNSLEFFPNKQTIGIKFARIK